jgi:hypothetical protein
VKAIYQIQNAKDNAASLHTVRAGEVAENSARRVYAAAAGLALWLPPEGGVPRALSGHASGDPGNFLSRQRPH